MITIQKHVLERMNDFASKSKKFSILFHFDFKSLNVSCVYFQKTQTIIIGLSERNAAWSIDISEGNISEKIPNEAYKLISDMLKKDEIYSNKSFFNALNETLIKLKQNEINYLTDSEILEKIKETKTNDKTFDKEGDKPFLTIGEELNQV